MINQYLSKPLSTEEIIEALERTEIEIEEVIKASPIDPKIVVGEVTGLIAHPNADKLKLATVKISPTKTLSIVCGAPNIAIGQHVPVATVGATLPDGLVIEARALRGEKSNGMICSEAELGISDDHSGIMILDHSTPIGKKLCDVWTQREILDIKTPTNRWDFNSVVGISREIAVYSSLADISLKIPKFTENTYNKIEDENVKKTGKCGRLILVKMRVNNSAPSPRWLVDNLRDSGMRSINPVVDITNYVMLEYGQPSHAYDARKLKKNISVRLGSPAQSLTTLDGVTRKLDEHDLTIVDGDTVVGLAGVMGGQSTEVDTATREIVLEVAQFDKTSVRKSAQRHGLRTEASARFERGLPLPLSRLAADRLIGLLREVCHGELVDSPADQMYGWPWVQHIGLHLRRAEALLGVSVDETTIIPGLRKLGFEVEHFSWAAEAKKYIGTPYKFGASFKIDGTSAFDCSYLTEYIYSRLGVMIGHTAKQQYDNGIPVNESDLKVGDLLFYSGHWQRLKAQDRGNIGHNGIYIGKNKVLEAVENKYNAKTKQYDKLEAPNVRISPLSDFVNNPSYQGARRYIDSFNHILAITAPWWRTDIRIEEDIVEEIIKLISYDVLSSELPQLPPQNDFEHQTLPRLMQLRHDMAAIGLSEVMTYSMVSAADITGIGLKISDHLEVANPLSAEQQYLRSTMLSSHLTAILRNKRPGAEIKIFEISKLFNKQPSTTPVHEHWGLGFLFAGDQAANQIRSFVQWLGDALRHRLIMTPRDFDRYIPGRSATISAQTDQLGSFGQLASKVLPRELREDEIWYGEVNLETLITQPFDAKAPELIPYQLVRRAITLVVAQSMSWAQVVEVLDSHPAIKQYKFGSDFYSDDTKSINFNVEYDCGPNPTQAAIEATHTSVTTDLAKKLSAKLK